MFEEIRDHVQKVMASVQDVENLGESFDYINNFITQYETGNLLRDNSVQSDSGADDGDAAGAVADGVAKDSADGVDYREKYMALKEQYIRRFGDKERVIVQGANDTEREETIDPADLTPDQLDFYGGSE